MDALMRPIQEFVLANWDFIQEFVLANVAFEFATLILVLMNEFVLATKLFCFEADHVFIVEVKFVSSTSAPKYPVYTSNERAVLPDLTDRS
jgi:hypothetical protein